MLQKKSSVCVARSSLRPLTAGAGGAVVSIAASQAADLGLIPCHCMNRFPAGCPNAATKIIMIDSGLCVLNSNQV